MKITLELRPPLGESLPAVTGRSLLLFFDQPGDHDNHDEHGGGDVDDNDDFGGDEELLEWIIAKSFSRVCFCQMNNKPQFHFL